MSTSSTTSTSNKTSKRSQRKDKKWIANPSKNIYVKMGHEGVVNRKKAKIVLLGNFSECFNKKVAEISEYIGSSCEALHKDGTGDYNFQVFFDKIHEEFNELENIVNGSAKFQNENDLMKYKLILQELRSNYLKAYKMLISEKDKALEETKCFSNIILGSHIKKSDQQLHPELIEAAAQDGILSPPALVKNNYSGLTISQKEAEHICLNEDELKYKDVVLSNLDNCFVELRGCLGSLQLHNVNNCIVLVGPVCRTAFALSCKSTVVAVACQQLIMHSSESIYLFLFASWRVMMQDCLKIDISTYCFDYPQLKEHFTLSGLCNGTEAIENVEFCWAPEDAPLPIWNGIENTVLPDWNALLKFFGQKVIEKKILKGIEAVNNYK